MTQTIVAELDALRALARALVHGDADADDLVQDTAIAALEHPPALDRPVRPWFGAVLRNRWRMAHRTATRRQAREVMAARASEPAPAADELLDRARALERLAAALVALPEPFRATVVRRYLDGESSAAIARSAGVPTGTVRWRLAEGLARLRAALTHDQDGARWQRALVPLAGVAVKTKTGSLTAVIVVVLMLLGGAAWWLHERRDPTPAPVAAAPTVQPLARSAALPARPIRDPRPGQGRAVVAAGDLAGGAVTGRVINWSTGDGVEGADLTFTTAAGAESVHSGDGGAFRLVPTAPGTYTLATATAPGFLPYAPELAHSSVRVVTTANREVRGVTVFLYPALDYHGRVIDAAGAPVPGAHVRLLGTPANEQAIDWLASEWTTDRDGAFTFHAADTAVLEASTATARGWGSVDGTVEVSKQLVIRIGEVPARTEIISGKVVDDAGAPLAGVLVRASPWTASTHDNPFHAGTIATAFALSSPTGAFTLTELAPHDYDLDAELDDHHAPVVQRAVAAGTTNVVLAMDRGIALTGSVVDPENQPVPAFTLIVTQRTGVVDEVVAQRTVIDAGGQFAIPVAAGEYQIVASAAGWAPSVRTPASAVAGGASVSVSVRVSAGATLRGTVTSTVDGKPIRYARVSLEGRTAGASTAPTNVGTLTGADGSYELTGIPPGPLAVSIVADQCHPRIESGLDAHDGADLPSLDVALAPLGPGESPLIELIGIGVKLSDAPDALHVDVVVPDSGAADAGILSGDLIVSIDGTLVTAPGMDDALTLIRGPAGTTVVIGVRRGEQQLSFTVVRRKIRA